MIRYQISFGISKICLILYSYVSIRINKTISENIKKKIDTYQNISILQFWHIISIYQKVYQKVLIYQAGPSDHPGTENLGVPARVGLDSHTPSLQKVIKYIKRYAYRLTYFMIFCNDRMNSWVVYKMEGILYKKDQENCKTFYTIRNIRSGLGAVLKQVSSTSW